MSVPKDQPNMRTVRVKKGELLAKLRGNRVGHRKVFEEALEGYRKEVIAHLEQMLGDARKNKRIQQYLSVEEPMDQTNEYDQAIAMLEMSLDEEITLTREEFASYVMDQWSWKRQFLTTNAKYSGTAAASL